MSESDQIIERDGVKISSAIFKFFADDANVGALYRFLKREDGVITVKRENWTCAARA
jgi:hypothetical protein